VDVRFQQSAVREYQIARRYYSHIDPNLADRFRSAVDAVVTRILENPDSLPLADRGFRRGRVKKFPYVLFFKVLGVETVGVYAVAHTSRRPGYWRRRRFDKE
jgi:plasmid stabilization system protein ParE